MLRYSHLEMRRVRWWVTGNEHRTSLCGVVGTCWHQTLRSRPRTWQAHGIESKGRAILAKGRHLARALGKCRSAPPSVVDGP